VKVNNLKFAKSIEPDNEAVNAKFAEASAKRAAGEFTVPSTVAEELTYNPFMRVNVASVKHAVGLPNGSSVEVMQKVRVMKDKF
jgi:hydroxyacylglutathione hydrolase